MASTQSCHRLSVALEEGKSRPSLGSGSTWVKKRRRRRDFVFLPFFCLLACCFKGIYFSKDRIVNIYQYQHFLGETREFKKLTIL